MKILLIAFFSLLSTILLAQDNDGYIFTKEQHEQIKKNLQDYKILIKDYEFKSKQFDSLKLIFELTKNKYQVQKFEYNKLLEKYNRINIDHSNLLYLKSENEKLKMEILSLNHELKYKNKSINFYKDKYYKAAKLDKGDRIARNFIWGAFGMLTVWTLYISYETVYGF